MQHRAHLVVTRLVGPTMAGPTTEVLQRTVDLLSVEDASPRGLRRFRGWLADSRAARVPIQERAIAAMHRAGLGGDG